MMLRIGNADTVSLFDMGRSPLGFLLSPVCAFRVGDTLMDTGTNRAGNGFLAVFKGKNVKKIINTHHHEDHIGNNAEV